MATLAQAAATHVASEHTRGFITYTWLQNCRLSSELSRVFRTAILRRVSVPPRVLRIYVGGVGSLLQLDHGHTQHARLQACTEYRRTSGILL